MKRVGKYLLIGILFLCFCKDIFGIVCKAQEVHPVEVRFENEELNYYYEQNITYEELPACYVLYEDGSKNYIMDYDCQVDWEERKLYLYWEDLRQVYDITIVEHRLEEIDIELLSKDKEATDTFNAEDFLVIGKYLDGSKYVLKEYELQVEPMPKQSDVKITVSLDGITESCFLSEQKRPLVPSTVSGAASVSQQPSKQEISVTDVPSVSPENERKEETVTKTAVPQVTSENANGSAGEKQTDSQIEISAPQVSDTVPPVIHLSKKVYRPGVKVKVTDADSGVASISIREGKKKKTIKNGTALTKEGNYEIIAKDKDGNESKVNISVEKPVKSMKINFALLRKWKQVDFMAVVTGTKRTPYWSVSNKKVGKITAKGEFQAKKSGVCYVIAKLDQKKAKRKVIVDMKQKFVLVY